MTLKQALHCKTQKELAKVLRTNTMTLKRVANLESSTALTRSYELLEKFAAKIPEEEVREILKG